MEWQGTWVVEIEKLMRGRGLNQDWLLEQRRLKISGKGCPGLELTSVSVLVVVGEITADRAWVKSPSHWITRAGITTILLLWDRHF